VACQIFDILFPNTVQMSKVNWGAKNEWEFINNYKVLQSACDKLGVDKKIDVDRLIKARQQDNLEFLQWLKKFYDDNAASAVISDYDCQGRRSIGKGVGILKWNKTPPVSTGSSAISPTKPSIVRPVRSANVGTTTTSPPGGGAASQTTSKVAKSTAAASATKVQLEKENNQDIIVSTMKMEMDSLRERLTKDNEELTENIIKLEHLLKICQQERDYYFGKLKSVELALQQKDLEQDVNMLSSTLSHILYEDTKGNPPTSSIGAEEEGGGEVVG
jgi:RP/EB family microtubule-associated protein